MIKHSFSDFSYAVNIDSAKKGQKEVLVCFIYNGIEVLKKVYIPEKAGTAYILEAKKIIDQEMRDGTLAIYSHKFINRNKRKKIQPKKVVAAAAKGEKIAPIATPADPSPKGNKKWVIATVVVAAVAVACAATAIVFATKGGGSEPGPGPTPETQYLVNFDTQGGTSIEAKQVTSGKPVDNPGRSATTKDGYNFLDWYPSKDAQTPWDFSTPITKNITIYARWAIDSYEIKFDPAGGIWNNGGSQIKSVWVEYDKMPSPGDYVTKEGFTFGGWNPEISPAIKETTYTAKWDKVPDYDVTFDGSDTFVAYDGATSVAPKTAYSCKITLSDSADPANYEIDRENIVVYAGQAPLIEGTDYTLSSYDEGEGPEAKRVLELSIKEGKITGALFISAKSVQRSSVNDFNCEFNEETKTATIYGLDLKAGQKLENITEINIPDYVEKGEDKYEVVAIDITKDPAYDPETNAGIGLLTKCGSLRKLTIPFVGLNKNVTITATDSNIESHLFGSLFGKKAFKNAETTTYQDHFYNNVEGEEVHVYKEARIPNTLREITIAHYNNVKYGTEESIKAIPMCAFSNCAYITDVKIADPDYPSITTANIGRNAFNGCRALSSFTYQHTTDSKNANAITPTMTIGKNAFNGCGVLTSFDFTAVNTIDECAFQDCVGMISVYLPTTVETIKTGALKGYYGLIKCQDSKAKDTWENGWADENAPIIYNSAEDTNPITDNNGKYSCLITTDGEGNSSAYIVQYLGSLEETTISVPGTLNFSDSGYGDDVPVQYIGAQSFMDFNLTTSITVSCPSLVSIEAEAFKKCLKLSTITFTGCTNLKNIGCNAFEGCAELQYINGLSGTNSNIETIGNYAFYNCKKLVGESASSKVLRFSKANSVGVSAFEGCSAITSVTLNTTQVALNDGAFKDCENLKTISYGVSNGIIPNYCFYNTALTTANIYAGVTEVGDYAFALCSKITKITINTNNKMTKVGDSAFLRCKALTDAVVFPNTLESLGASAFQDCHKLSGIKFNGTKLINIPDSVCYGDTNLGYFDYPTTTQIETIGAYAFANDQSLDYIGTTSNTMPTSLKSIGDRAFVNCISIGRGTDSTKYFYIKHGTNQKLYMGEEVFLGWYNRYSDSERPQVVKVDSAWYNGTELKITWSEGCVWNLKDYYASVLGGNYLEYPQSEGGVWYLNVDKVTS